MFYEGTLGKAHAFPTGVGMNRPRHQKRGDEDGVPHGRGDEPDDIDFAAYRHERSPRAWG